MVLVIPNKVTNIHNKSTTFRVYDPNQAIGDISPTAVSQQAQAAPPKKKHGCGGVGSDSGGHHLANMTFNPGMASSPHARSVVMAGSPSAMASAMQVRSPRPLPLDFVA